MNTTLLEAHCFLALSGKHAVLPFVQMPLTRLPPVLLNLPIMPGRGELMKSKVSYFHIQVFAISNSVYLNLAAQREAKKAKAAGTL